MSALSFDSTSVSGAAATTTPSILAPVVAQAERGPPLAPAVRRAAEKRPHTADNEVLAAIKAEFEARGIVFKWREPVYPCGMSYSHE